LQGAVLKISGQNQVLKGDLGRNLVPRFSRDGQFAQVQEGPAQDTPQLLEEGLLGDPAFPGNEFQERFLRTVRDRHAPALLPILELLGRGKGRRGQDIF